MPWDQVAVRFGRPDAWQKLLREEKLSWYWFRHFRSRSRCVDCKRLNHAVSRCHEQCLWTYAMRPSHWEVWVQTCNAVAWERSFEKIFSSRSNAFCEDVVVKRTVQRVGAMNNAYGRMSWDQIAARIANIRRVFWWWWSLSIHVLTLSILWLANQIYPFRRRGYRGDR